MFHDSLSSVTTEPDLASRPLHGLDLTGHFLEAFVFAALNKPLPPARVWLIDRLRDAQRL